MGSQQAAQTRTIFSMRFRGGLCLIERSRCRGGAAWALGSRVGVKVLLPERMGCRNPLSDRRFSDGYDEPSAPTHDRGHDDPQSVAGDAAILRPRGFEVQRIFSSLARPARPGGCSGLSGASGFEGRRLGVAEPGRLRLALLLRRDARRTDDPGADRLRPRTAQSAPTRSCGSWSRFRA